MKSRELPRKVRESPLTQLGIMTMTASSTRHGKTTVKKHIAQSRWERHLKRR